MWELEEKCVVIDKIWLIMTVVVHTQKYGDLNKHLYLSKQEVIISTEAHDLETWQIAEELKLSQGLSGQN